MRACYSFLWLPSKAFSGGIHVRAKEGLAWARWKFPGGERRTGATKAFAGMARYGLTSGKPIRELSATTLAGSRWGGCPDRTTRCSCVSRRWAGCTPARQSLAALVRGRTISLLVVFFSGRSPTNSASVRDEHMQADGFAPGNADTYKPYAVTKARWAGESFVRAFLFAGHKPENPEDQRREIRWENLFILIFNSALLFFLFRFFTAKPSVIC